MAASTPYPRSDPHPPGDTYCLSPAGLHARLEEEINRAERHGLNLSCLLVVIENLDELAGVHGEELREQALEYVADALGRELRRFDRVGRPSDRELAIVLPGADGPRGEMVARRVLDRLRAIKVEAAGQRRSLVVSVGLAPWREGAGADDLLARARAASRQGNGEDSSPGTADPLRPEVGRPARS
ncbi:MAG TPA: diguanylate cyclase [Solirubrobacteraceae bacterium]|jgi:diguanylate cyclase (GGDEF)-like protein